MKGFKPTSNATVAVRGIANKGPIVKYSMHVNKIEYTLLTGFAISNKLSLWEMAVAITPNSGSPTPVIKNPIVACNVLLPADCPIWTGNIKLPAPKNNPNNNEPINKFDWKLSFSFINKTPRCQIVINIVF